MKFLSLNNLGITRNDLTYEIETQIWIGAVLTAGGSVTNTEKDAINTYVKTAKYDTNNWWWDTYADYPMVGGNAAGFAINLKEPGLYTITWAGAAAGAFTSTGWKPDGVDAVGKTGFIPSSSMSLNSTTIEYYSRDATLANTFEIGAKVSASQVIQFWMKGTGSEFHCDIYSSGDGRILGNFGVDSQGSYIVSRESSTSMIAYRNATSFASIATTAGTLPDIEMYLGALNSAGTAGSFTTRECAGALFAQGFDANQVTAQYNARQAMNTSLSRQV